MGAEREVQLPPGTDTIFEAADEVNTVVLVDLNVGIKNLFVGANGLEGAKHHGIHLVFECRRRIGSDQGQ